MHASTYSIVAVDRESGECGVAVQSKFLAVGALIPWAEVDAGAVATQSWIRMSYGPDGLAMLRDGVSATEVVERLVAADEGRDRRQVGAVDLNGGSAAYTGSRCPDAAGERLGPGYAIQGNTLVSATVLDAMVDAFLATPAAPLADRLLAALSAAQAEGGDRRGQQSAAVRVVKSGAGYLGADVAVDLRADDHPEPIAELERLYALHDLYFGETPRDQWVAVDAPLATELRERLAAHGCAGGDLLTDLEDWAGIENLEERVEGVERLDPVVLAHLRANQP